MPIQISCPCGAGFRIPDEYANRKVACPACSAILSGPHGPSLSEAKAAPLPVPLEPFEDPIEEVFPEQEKKARKRKKQARARRQGINKASLGLGFHYAIPFLVLPAMWVGWLSLGLLLMANNPDLENASQPVDFFLIAGGIFTLLAGLMEIPTFILCLGIADSRGRGLLVLSLAMRFLAVLLAILVQIVPDYRPVLLLGTFILMMTSWVIWMLFLRQLAFYIEHPELGDDAVRTLWSGVWTLIGSVIFMFVVVLVIMLIVSIKIAFARYALMFTALTVLGALVRISIVLREGDSFLTFFLAPTGLIFAFKYLDLIASLRLVMLRRS